MASPTASGSLIADRYRVTERLGSGGMATVYLAEDERLGRRVAVKRLHAGSPEDTAKRFRREARLGASLNHPNIVTVFDTVTDEGSVVIVMEHVDGETLADMVRRGRVEPGEAVRILRAVAAALDHAHEHGIVHRDIKPANVLLGRNGEVKLVDLGIATAVEGTRITSSGSVMGTAAYMAPEQLDGRDAAPATDFYALAAVAYEMLAGQPAYRGATPVEIAHAVVSGPPPDLRSAWPEAPDGVAEVLRRGMAFDPADRPASATEFVDELERALKPAPTARTSALPSTRPEPVQERGRTPFLREDPRDTRRRPRSAPRDRSFAPLLALLGLALVGGVLAFVLLSGGDDGGGKSSDSSSASAEQRRQARAERRRARREREQQQQQDQPQAATPAPAPDQPSGSSDGGSGGSSSSDYKIPQPSGSSVAEGSRLQLQGHQMIDSDPKGAVKVLERSVKAFPAGTDDIHLQYAYFSLGKALRLSGRPEDAIPVLELRLKNPDQRSTVQAELDKAKAAAG
jgi:eukaryotic-like serine/threonine-protein kinase